MVMLWNTEPFSVFVVFRWCAGETLLSWVLCPELFLGLWGQYPTRSATCPPAWHDAQHPPAFPGSPEPSLLLLPEIPVSYLLLTKCLSGMPLPNSLDLIFDLWDLKLCCSVQLECVRNLKKFLLSFFTLSVSLSLPSSFTPEGNPETPKGQVAAPSRGVLGAATRPWPRVGFPPFSGLRFRIGDFYSCHFKLCCEPL